MTAEQFNALVPAGTPVVYWSVRNETRPWFKGQPGMATRTRSEAWHLPAGHVIVKVEGIAGGVNVEHVRVDAAKMIRDCAAAVRSQTTPVRICMSHGAQPCTCQPLADMDPEPPKPTEEQLEAVAEELAICYECSQAVQPIPELPLEAEPPTPDPPERHPDCKCESGGICWFCLARGEAGP